MSDLNVLFRDVWFTASGLKMTGLDRFPVYQCFGLKRVSLYKVLNLLI